MDLPCSRAETKSPAWAPGQAGQPKGSQIPLPIDCFISITCLLIWKAGVGWDRVGTPEFLQPCPWKGLAHFALSIPQQLLSHSSGKAELGPRLSHLLPTVCSMAPEHLWKLGKTAWKEEGMSVNMHGPFLDSHMDAFSNFLSDSRNQPSQWQGEGPGTYFP